jgi:hypothetical protein
MPSTRTLSRPRSDRRGTCQAEGVRSRHKRQLPDTRGPPLKPPTWTVSEPPPPGPKLPLPTRAGLLPKTPAASVLNAAPSLVIVAVNVPTVPGGSLAPIVQPTTQPLSSASTAIPPPPSTMKPPSRAAVTGKPASDHAPKTSVGPGPHNDGRRRARRHNSRSKSYVGGVYNAGYNAIDGHAARSITDHPNNDDAARKGRADGNARHRVGS